MRTTLTQSRSDLAPSSTLGPAEPAHKVLGRNWGEPEQSYFDRSSIGPQVGVRDHVGELLTGAASQVRQQRVSAVAAALVAALRVGAESLAAAVLDGALVDV